MVAVDVEDECGDVLEEAKRAARVVGRSAGRSVNERRASRLCRLPLRPPCSALFALCHRSTRSSSSVLYTVSLAF